MVDASAPSRGAQSANEVHSTADCAGRGWGHTTAGRAADAVALTAEPVKELAW